MRPSEAIGPGGSRLTPSAVVLVLGLMNALHRLTELRLSSPDYSFRAGRVVVFRLDDFSRTGHPAEGGPSSSEVRGPQVQEGSLWDNAISGVELSDPGRYRCVLANLEVVRLRDKKDFHVPSFVLPEFNLGELALEKGMAEINVTARGIFKVVALGKDQRPIPRRRVQLTSTAMCSEVTTDDNGEFIFLGNPTQYLFELPPEGNDSFGLLIMPL